MGVATHLGIKLSEYDARIRTFIPDYEEMLGVAAEVIPAELKPSLTLAWAQVHWHRGARARRRRRKFSASMWMLT